jgi:hypothetical protein
MKARVFSMTALAAGTLSAINFLAAPPATAAVDNIVLNQWYTGHFTNTGSALLAGAFTLGTDGPIKPWPLFGNAIAAPGVFGADGVWTITLPSSGTLTVTDVETSGDRFALFDNGNAMTPAASPFGPAPQNPGQAAVGALTSKPVANASFGVEDINVALGNADYSSGTFRLDPGVNVITGVFLGTIGNGDVNFIAESSIPELQTWAMMLLGFAGIGYAGYRKTRRVIPNLSST